MPIVRGTNSRKYAATEQYGGYIRMFHDAGLRRQALMSIGPKHIINLSTGFNLRPAPAPLLRQVARDATNPFLYRNYEPPSGHIIWLQAVLAHERFRSIFADHLTTANVCVLSGSCVSFHYFARHLSESFERPEVVALAPTYAGFGENMAPYGIPVVEVYSAKSPGTIPSIDEIEEALTPNTKLIFSGPVNNPTGEIVTREFAKELLRLAKRRSILLLWDETSITFTDPEELALDMWAFADELDAQDNLAVVSSLSKDRGLPSYRIAWLIGPAPLVAKFAEYNSNLYSIPATLFTGLVLKELLFRSTSASRFGTLSDLEKSQHFLSMVFDPLDLNYQDGRSVETRFHQFLVPGFQEFMTSFVYTEQLLEELTEYRAWMVESRSLYESNWSFTKSILTPAAVDLPMRRAGFNCFVRISSLDRAKQDVCVKRMFLESGVEVLPGPAFGLLPQTWQDGLGFWARITLSSSRPILEEGLDRLTAYVSSYVQQGG